MYTNTQIPGFVHSKFRLNGFNLTADDLCRIAYSFIKEGEPYEKSIGIFILDWFDAKDYVEMQTSGTTGTPKIIRVKKQAMVNSAIATGEYFDLGHSIKVLHCLPTQFVAGKMMFVRAFILGWNMDVVEPTSTPLQRNTTTYDFAAMVPLQAKQSLDKLHKVKKLILGGAKVSGDLVGQLEKLPTQVFETYGMTETITHIAAKRVGESAFEALPNINLSQDERGCLVINAKELTNEPVVTNDVVDLINDTHFIWLGRYDNVINSGGIKLYPEQIEEKLSHRIDRRFFVKGIADETLGEKLVLVIEGEKFDIDDEILGILDKYEKPKEIIFAEKFTETGSGKLQRELILKNI
ncbi:AMP-binding protein [Flavobacterium sp. Sd200]|uniref:AMP-binding protein n=1 Tax=Flavobacterium sp. Sd200 TaxID=2692211 RepID=UPI001371A6F8|nr:AMP-binding protein [Flavobacterium sp. Sd200]MXN90254.1 AMP-binding protein [Flavobacterium sp. Sd200]